MPDVRRILRKANMKSFWIKVLAIAIVSSTVSVYLHEVGHWIIYELHGIDSWISFQRVNLINPEQVTEGAFLQSLFGGPLMTIMLASGSYFLLMKFQDSLWLFIFGLINASLRILPTIVGSIKSLNTENLNGFSDEGNIALRITELVLLREIMMLILLGFYALLIFKTYKTFHFPEEIRRKKLFVAMLCIFPVFISMILPKLDFLVFGV